MPMSKAEKEAVQLRAALAWPAPPPEPADVKMFADDAGLFRGWWVNTFAGRVGEGIVLSNLHAHTPYTSEQIAQRYGRGSQVTLSQGQGGPWYHTEADALRALHHAVAMECAEKLRAVEIRIEEAGRR